MPRTLLIVNSIDRDSTSASSSDFNVRINPAISGIRRIRLSSVSLPVTFYNIVSGINDRVCWNRSATNYSYQIPAGSYDINTLLTTIQAGMNGVDANTYICSVSATTLKVTITGSAAFVLNWSTNPVASTSCYYELGWNQSDTTSATSQVAPRVYDLSKPAYIYLYCQNIPSGVQIRTTNASADKITFAFPLSVNRGNVQDYNPEGEGLEQALNQHLFTLSNLQVQLFSRNNQAISLNGAEWSFALLIDYE